MKATLNFAFKRRSKNFSDWKENVIQMKHYFNNDQFIVQPLRTDHNWK